MPDAVRQPLGGERLCDEVVDSILDRLHGHRNIAVAGDEDDRNIGILLLQALEELQPVDTRHADVGYDDAIEMPVEYGKRICRRGEGLYLKSGKLQRLLRCLQKIAVVIQQDDGEGIVRCYALCHGALTR